MDKQAPLLDASTVPLEAIAAIPILEHAALPTDTDPAIQTSTLGDQTQFAYLPNATAARKDRLFIYIPGTWATPILYNDVCKEAAYTGYYSFAVAYSNLTPVEWKIGSNPNDSTAENIFEEFLTGNNASNKVNVSRTNSFENRIIKMIIYLQEHFPAENWKRFLNRDTTLRWEKISVAGHSQGSDHAMYMSKKRSLFRAAFHAGPGSFRLPNGNMPGFITRPGLTPPEKLYGFNHTADFTRVWSDVKLVWAALGIPGLPEDIDDGKPSSAHQLTSSLDISDTHSGIIQDELTPRDENGAPLYAPVWRYGSFPAR